MGLVDVQQRDHAVDPDPPVRPRNLGRIAEDPDLDLAIGGDDPRIAEPPIGHRHQQRVPH